jgi:DnaJ-class molecular chaperone
MSFFSKTTYVYITCFWGISAYTLHASLEVWTSIKRVDHSKYFNQAYKEEPMNLKKCLSDKTAKQKPDIQECKVRCTSCNGSGRIVTGIKAICTEPIEMVEKCPACKGKGYL